MTVSKGVDKIPQPAALAPLAAPLAALCDIDGALCVRLDGDVVLPAKRAVSCPIEPQAGDRVCYVADDERAYVLAVLERQNPDAEIQLAYDSPLELRAPSIRLSGENVSITATNINIVSRAVHYLTKFFKKIAHVDESVSLTRTVKTATDTVVVQNASHQTYGILSQQVDGPSLHRADASFIKATGDVRIDGERITVA